MDTTKDRRDAGNYFDLKRVLGNYGEHTALRAVLLIRETDWNRIPRETRHKMVL